MNKYTPKQLKQLLILLYKIPDFKREIKRHIGSTDCVSFVI